MSVIETLADAPMPAALPPGAEERRARLRVAEMLAKQGMDTSPVQHWTQGAARVAQALMGGFERGAVAREERDEEKALNDYQKKAPWLGGGSPVPTAAPAPDRVASALLPPVPTAAADPDMAPIGTTSAPSPAPAVMAAGAGVPASIRNNNPGAQWPGPSANTYGATGAQTIGGGNKIASFPDPVSGAAAQFDLLGRNYAGMPLSAAIAKWSGNNNAPTYIAHVQKATGLAPDTVITPELLRSPQGLALAQAMAKHEAGREFPLTPEQWSQAQSRAFGGQGGAAAAAPTGAAPGAAVAPGAGRAAPQMDPATAVYIKQALDSSSPKVREWGRQIAAQFAKPVDSNFDKFDSEHVYDKKTGRMVRVMGESYKPLVDPAERAQHGIPKEDTRPYQLGPGNKLINPPAETRFTVDQRGESKFSEAASKLVAERFNKHVDAANEAPGMVAQLGYLREIGSRIETGKTAEVMAVLGPYAEALGIPIKDLGEMQAYKAIVAKMAPSMRVAGSGATSDFEMRQYLESLPGLGKTAEGNAIISNTLEALLQYNIARGEIASRAMAGELRPAEAEKAIRELPDPLQLWKKSRGASPAATRRYNPETGKIE